MKTITWGKVGDCFVLAIGRQQPNDAEFKQYIDFVRAQIRSDMKPRVLVRSHGGALTPKQRQALNELTAPFAKVARIAVLTDSTVGRSIVTAMSWFAKEVYEAFPMGETDGAIRFLQIPSHQQAELRSMLWRFDADVGR